MNFKNKFNVTTKKFYMVLDTDEIKEGELLFIYNGSINDYLHESLVSYAGKAIKTINRTINEKLEILSSTNNDFAYRHDLMSIIARLTDTVNELSKYREYDLVGIYDKSSYDYKVVDYKKVEELAMKNIGYKFVEIPKELYIKLVTIENKTKNSYKNKCNKGLLQSAKKLFLNFFGWAVIFVFVFTPIYLGYSFANGAFDFLIKY
ncbi:hypothetical protein [Pseudomonas sp. HY7a-MNA-CIBAN-0227]|uniref:hypothetical protein n=1 Tax=Pseudomonas sp. HY7a-MNA-CIBAN-0227 TaxID=3140474 RepID=UPI003320FD78